MDAIVRWPNNNDLRWKDLIIPKEDLLFWGQGTKGSVLVSEAILPEQ